MTALPSSLEHTVPLGWEMGEEEHCTVTEARWFQWQVGEPSSSGGFEAGAVGLEGEGNAWELVEYWPVVMAYAGEGGSYPGRTEEGAHSRFAGLREAKMSAAKDRTLVGQQEEKSEEVHSIVAGASLGRLRG